jgi:uncharacterized membrane protein YfcA
MIASSVFFIGLLTGLIDALLGIGGLISIPLMIFMGLPPHTAIACDRFGILGTCLGSFYRHYKAKTIVWRWVPALSFLALIGGLGGSALVVELNPEVLKKYIGIIILLILPFTLIKQEWGTIDSQHTKKRHHYILGLSLYLLLSFYGGFIGVYSGPFFMIVMSAFFGLTLLQIQGTDQIPWLVLSLSSFVIFLSANHVDWLLCCLMFLGMVLGGYLGASLAFKIGNKNLKYLFLIACGLGAISLLSGI